MNEKMKRATDILWDVIGQDKIMTLATRNGDGVAARTVNVYTHNESFYFITENDSNKYLQINQNANVALSVDAIQITGQAAFLEHPMDSSNKPIADAIEKQLPQQFSSYASDPTKRLLRITPIFASFILLETGEGFVIDFLAGDAKEIKHQM